MQITLVIGDSTQARMVVKGGIQVVRSDDRYIDQGAIGFFADVRVAFALHFPGAFYQVHIKQTYSHK